jgi:hypothetical protein
LPLVLLALAVIVLPLVAAGHSEAAACIAGGYILFLGAARLTARRAWTSVGADGIVYFAGIGRIRRIPWREITDIQTKIIPARGTGPMNMLGVTCRDGKTRTVPMVVSTATAPDPDFEQKVEQIISLWHQYATTDHE